LDIADYLYEREHKEPYLDLKKRLSDEAQTRLTRAVEVLKNLIQASGITTHPIPLHDAEVFISEVDPEFAREMGSKIPSSIKNLRKPRLTALTAPRRSSRRSESN
jgi:hypothetical protein